VSRFFPDARHVSAARVFFSSGRNGDLPHVMGTALLPCPRIDDLHTVLDEFAELAATLGLARNTSSVMVLVPVCVNGSVLTTPVLLDLERHELAFTSHPALGAGVIPDAVLAENADLASAVREELLGVLAMWRDAPAQALAQ
jgi:hypothetical protein